MKIINKAIISLATLTCLILSGCNGEAIHFKHNEKKFNRKNIDFSMGREVSATASGFQLLLFFPFNVNERQQIAYQSIKSQARRDYITNIRITESWTYAFIGTIYKTRIDATAYPYKNKD